MKEAYCLCCGENVETTFIERYNNVEVTCVYCGFTIDIQEVAGKSEIREEKTREARCILVAEDSEVIRTFIELYLKKQHLAKEILVFENGKDFVKAATDRLKNSHPVDLVILDIEMPEMDGITAARMFRALEKHCRKKPVPIIFFSSCKADEKLKKQMTLYRPVRYLNKGSSSDPDELLKRIKVLVSRSAVIFSESPRRS